MAGGESGGVCDILGNDTADKFPSRECGDYQKKVSFPSCIAKRFRTK
jgi:hypothetical protein